MGTDYHDQMLQYLMTTVDQWSAIPLSVETLRATGKVCFSPIVNFGSRIQCTEII